MKREFIKIHKFAGRLKPQRHKRSPPSRTKKLVLTRDGGFCLCRRDFNRRVSISEC